jgi:hypothetical protein
MDAPIKPKSFHQKGATLMGPGLAKILELIDANPADSMLVDRYLILASDIPEHERVDATIQLASSLLKRNPRRALEVAWMLYKSSLRDMDSLELISQALDDLGKSNKAAIIRSEMKRINNDQLSDDVKRLARLTIEEHVTNTILGRDNGVQWNPNENTQSQQISFAEFNLDGSVPKQEPEALVSSFLETQQIDSLIDDLRLEPAPARFVQTPKQEANASVARVSAATPGAGIPEAIPPKEPSKHSIGMFSRVVNHVTEHNEASFRPIEESRKRLKSLVAAEKWDGVYNLLQEAFSTADDKILLSLFQQHKLAQIDLRYAEFWIDILIAAKQERRALRYILQKLNEEPHLAWARMVYPKIKIIRESLDLTSFEWHEAEGVSALRDNTAKMRPRLGCYWAS